jgi:hypothetical protein
MRRDRPAVPTKPTAGRTYRFYGASWTCVAWPLNTRVAPTGMIGTIASVIVILTSFEWP